MIFKKIKSKHKAELLKLEQEDRFGHLPAKHNLAVRKHLCDSFTELGMDSSATKIGVKDNREQHNRMTISTNPTCSSAIGEIHGTTTNESDIPTANT